MSRTLRSADFDYPLPPDRIAQEPLPDRSASRLLVLDRGNPTLRHGHFTDLATLVAPLDVLVLNASRVIPARLHGKRERGGPAELLLVRALGDGTWEALVHPGGKLKAGRRMTFGDDAAAEIVAILGGGLRRVRFMGTLDARGALAKYGEVPLPPYIHRPPTDADRERYQTVYAAHDGSVAAPTAGLHFTEALLDRIRAQGTAVVTVDLHVGPGTFRPVEVEDLAAHPMHAEAYVVGADAAATINARRRAGGTVWAVGTTAVRTLETVAGADGEVQAGVGDTRLFIYPPYPFKVVDRMVTNFHLPRSTLLMLVCAFGGYARVMDAYREAVREGYRFYSYGDAMVLL